ncbi:rsm22-cox11 tandem protein 2, mitochondrial [Euphorbia lathyris]|uniref:rsm22-cox11 tandem protein 2, mitochondrial n=1 Tax=Euphorbia lathyris TaxID=212925 RepID=UPI003313B834
MASLIPETAKKVFTPENLLSAAKQSKGCLVVPVSLRRAIKRYLRELEEPHMKRKVLRLSESFSSIKEVNLMLTTNTGKELFEDPFKSMERSKRWKIKSAYGDIGFEYTDDQTVAYVASRMPAVFSACHRVLNEVKRRLPDFSPAKVLDFGGGTGSAFWATREVWPKSVEKVNLVEPSQSMQRAGRSLIQGLKDLPLIHSYTSLQGLSRNINKSEREHDLVIASYVLGEIPSLKDRITIVRQLWDLTKDVLVLIEPGTPDGSSIISQMRSHILWMEKRKSRKSEVQNKKASNDLIAVKSGAFIVAPCAHDGQCPLEKSGKYCHFSQRLQRTTSQRAYKRSKGEPLRGFEDEKFSFVVFRRGQRPRVSWPLDGMKFDTLNEQRMKRNPEELEIDYDDQIAQAEAEVEAGAVPRKEVNRHYYESDAIETDNDGENDEEEDDNDDVEDETVEADLGSGWGRIIFSPIRRGKLVSMDVCRSTNPEGTEGTFERIVATKNRNPVLHHQARKSLWGDLWPF